MLKRVAIADIDSRAIARLSTGYVSTYHYRYSDFDLPRQAQQHNEADFDRPLASIEHRRQR